MQRALRGYHAGPACHHAVSCELFIGKASLYSNDRFVDSILSMIESILNVLNNALKPTT